MVPSFRLEDRLKRRGYRLIAGVDEVGRGALAGPIVAAAVILPDNCRVRGIKDSKMLSAKQREALSRVIRETAVSWAVSLISHKVIDRRGLAWANQMVIKRTVEKIKPDYALIDGRQFSGKMPALYENIINGDKLVKSIAAASIIAKVIRDQYLEKLDHYYPEYGFAQHKGYGTRLHYEMICRYGVCEVHRCSFAPVKFLISIRPEFMAEG